MTARKKPAGDAARLAGELEAVRSRLRELSEELRSVEAEREKAGRSRGAALADGDEKTLATARETVRALTERREELRAALGELTTRDRDLGDRHALAAFREGDPKAATLLRELGDSSRRFLDEFARGWSAYLAALHARGAPPRSVSEDSTELGKVRQELGPTLRTLDQLQELVRWLEVPDAEGVTAHHAPNAPGPHEADLDPVLDSTLSEVTPR